MLGPAAGPAAAAAQRPASSSTTPAKRACQRAALGARGHRTFANATPANDPDGSPPVWRRRGRTFTGVAGHRERDRYRLRVCSISAAETEQQHRSGLAATRTLLSHGATVTVGRRARVTDAVVSDPWLTWATTAAGQAGLRIHRRAIAGNRLTTRRFRGRLLALATTTDGTTVLSTVERGLQRIYRWRTDGRTDSLITPREVRFGQNHRLEQEPVHVQLWDPDTVRLAPPAVRPYDDTYTPLSAGSLVATSRTTPCQRWPEPDALPAARASTSDLRATITDSGAWSRRASYDEPYWATASSVSRLEVCDARTGSRLLAVPAGYDTADNDDAGLDSVTIAGDAVLARGGYASGNTGSGSMAGPLEMGFVRGPEAGSWRQVEGRNIATLDAAAWVDGDAVWVSDALGTRTVAAVPEGFRGLRLAEATLTVVATAGDQRIALSPLPRARVAGDQLSRSTFSFGICTDQFASYCPDPAAVSGTPTGP